MEEKDLTREPGGRAWWEEEVEMLERRRARKPRQEHRPGAQSSKLEKFSIYSPFTIFHAGWPWT